MRISWSEDLEWRIKAFFDYWRQRHAFINDLDLSHHNHEANVLIWTSLDALSNLWGHNIGKEQCRKKGKRLIFDAFLARYGGELFQIVSLPDMWSRIDRREIVIDPKAKLNLPEDLCIFLNAIGERRTPMMLDEYQIRQISDDWSMDNIITDTLENYPTTNPAELEKWLSLSRYGAIAYKEMRTSYIHEGRPGNGSHSFNLSEKSLIRPTYLYGIYTTPNLIGFSIEFMSHVLEECINAFEAESLTLQQDPVPVS